MKTSWLLLVALPLLAQPTPLTSAQPAPLTLAQPTPLTLAELERLALASNPSLQQSAADVRAAAGRAQQAGLYPNPVIGGSGEHIATGPVLRGGTIGGFVEQRVITGGKLGLSRRAARQDQLASVEMQEAQRLRVLVSIRSLYYEALGGQRLLEIRQQMLDLATRTAKTARETANLGRLDRPDVLAAQVDQQRAELNVTLARNALDRIWREIAAMTGQPGLRQTTLDGDLETLPQLDAEAALARIYAESPLLKAAQLHRAGTDLQVSRARAEKIPDIVVKGGVRYNRELAIVDSPIGTEGFFDVGVQIPIFNRNQGAVRAAVAEADRARLETDREKLMLARRLASVYREYRDATAAAARYRDDMIPAAIEAYDMYMANFGQMTAAYTQVLLTQRSLIQMQEEYVAALTTAWRGAVEIQGLLVGEE